ncbi:hypothetical protein H9P43_006061 [Blastocladiella emersonii ATCC 22665]|nr:hypothetical protein H9P43_006061 [Blastocladiella emersonii ATCC 22665]
MLKRSRSPPWRPASLVAALALLLVCLVGRIAAATTVRVLMPPIFANTTIESVVMEPLAQEWSRTSGINIDFQFQPSQSSTDNVGTIQALFDAKSPYVDIFLVDVVWPGQFADHLLELDGRVSASVLAQHNQQIVEAGRVLGKLLAVPEAADFGVMFYRADLLAKYGYSGPPKTWSEMEAMITNILPQEQKVNPGLMGYISQLKPYEGLTCNVMEWLRSEDAGMILEPNRTLSSFGNTVVADKVLKIAQRWRRWLKNGIVGPLSIGADETTSLKLWLQGNVLFLRNWPFVAGQTRAANVSWAWNMTQLPGAQPGMSGATLGGWLWAVSKFSANPDAAVKALEFLLSARFQKARTVAHGILPTVMSLYRDPDVCATIGNCELFGGMSVAARPAGASGQRYQDVSMSIYTYWMSLLNGNAPEAKALDAMNRNIASVLSIDILGPPTNVRAGDGVAIAMMALSIIGLALVGLVALNLISLRNRPAIRKSAPAFMYLVLVGLTIEYVTVFTYVDVPSSTQCILQPWLLCFGFSIPLTAITLKGLRIYKIFNNPYAKRLNLPNRTLFTWIGGLLAVDSLLLIIWCAVDPPLPTDIKLASSRYTACSSKDPTFQSAMVGLLYFYHSLQLLAALWVAVKTRSAGQGYSESKSIGFSIYNLTLIITIAVPMSYADVLGQTIQFAIRSIGIFLATTTLLVSYFAPKLWNEFRNPSNVKGNNQESSAIASYQANAVGLMSSQHEGGNGNAGGGHGKNDLNHARELGFGREGMLSFRFGSSALRLQIAPWKPARALLLPAQRILILQHTGGDSADTHATVIPLDQITESGLRGTDGKLAQTDSTVSKASAGSGGGPSGARFIVILGKKTFEFMAATGDEASRWSDSITIARTSKANAGGSGGAAATNSKASGASQSPARAAVIRSESVRSTQ